jgi:hypothetical protein
MGRAWNEIREVATREAIALARISAERAVDDDFVESALEDGELLFIQLRDEHFRDGPEMDRSGLGEAGHSGVGQLNDDATSVRAGVRSPDEAFFDQPGDTPRHAGPRDERPVRELRHAQLAPRLGQLSDHVEEGLSQSRRLCEVGLEPAHERGMCPEERCPGLEAAPVGQSLRPEPFEESSHLGFGISLHVPRRLKSVAQDHSQLLLELNLEAAATRHAVQSLEQLDCVRT